jgi:hypothetical protein
MVPAGEVVLLTGNLTAAARYVTMLDFTASLGMTIWASWGWSLNGRLTIAQGDAWAGASDPAPALDELRAANLSYGTWCLLRPIGTLAGPDAKSRRGTNCDRGGSGNAERAGERWYVPELLRARGLLMLIDGATGQWNELKTASINL